MKVSALYLSMSLCVITELSSSTCLADSTFCAACVTLFSVAAPYEKLKKDLEPDVNVGGTKLKQFHQACSPPLSP